MVVSHVVPKRAFQSSVSLKKCCCKTHIALGYLLFLSGKGAKEQDNLLLEVYSFNIEHDIKIFKP